MQINQYLNTNNWNPLFEKFHLLKKSLTKLKKLKISSKKQILWSEGYFEISTPDKVAETINLIYKLNYCF